MRILIDTTEIRINRLNASIPIYITRYLSTIAIKDRKDYTLLINIECELFFKNNYPGFQLITFKFRGWNKYWHNNPLYLYTQYKFNKLIKKLKIDVIFIPTDYPLYLQNKICCKKVIVIHDLKGIKRCSNRFKDILESYILNRMYKRHLESSNVIIAISKFTKQDILTYYPTIDEQKIRVIYNSVILPLKSKQPINFVSNKYILYVNTLYKYKNAITLVRAFKKLANEISHNLIIVGKATEHWNNEIKPYITENEMDDRIIRLQDVSSEELKYLYENAALFVTSSLNEGFGFTPIEAAICKCPVICSLQEALPDSTQGLLNYYYPALDKDALAQQIRKLLNNPPSDNKLEEISNNFKDLYSPINQKKLLDDVLYSS